MGPAAAEAQFFFARAALSPNLFGTRVWPLARCAAKQIAPLQDFATGSPSGQNLNEKRARSLAVALQFSISNSFVQARAPLSPLSRPPVLWAQQLFARLLVGLRRSLRPRVARVHVARQPANSISLTSALLSSTGARVDDPQPARQPGRQAASSSSSPLPPPPPPKTTLPGDKSLAWAW